MSGYLTHLGNKIFGHRYLLQALVVRDLRARYFGSTLGGMWAFLHPLVQLLVYYFVFTYVLKARLGVEYEGTSYSLWLLAGLLPWILFSEIVARAPNNIMDHANLIKKSPFPSEYVSVSHLLAGTITHLAMLTILVGLTIFVSGALGWSALLVFVYLFGLGLFALGLSWLLSSLNLFFRDIGHALVVILHVWFFATPIFYPVTMIPERFRPMLNLNPMMHFVDGYRSALLGRTESSVWAMFALLLGAAAVMFFGGFVFRRLKPSFPDVL